MPGLSRFRRAMAASFVLAAFAFAATACEGPSLAEVNAALVAPPAVPKALPRTTSHVKVHLTAKETKREIAPGVQYTLWTFNDSVPGPLIRVHEGDTVEIFLKNDGSSSVSHNIDLHSVNGPGGGAEATTVMPGEEKSFSFEAKASGLFVYHCAAGIVADHIANGMYGGILVEPADGLPPVDREFYVGQSDFYTDLANGETGTAELSLEKLLAEQPTYVLFNGHTKSLLGDSALQGEDGRDGPHLFRPGRPQPDIELPRHRRDLR